MSREQAYIYFYASFCDKIHHDLLSIQIILGRILTTIEVLKLQKFVLAHVKNNLRGGNFRMFCMSEQICTLLRGELAQQDEMGLLL